MTAPVMHSGKHGYGLIPRDFKSHPPGCFAFAEPFPDSMIIPENEWQDRLNKQIADKSSLWDLRESNYDCLKSLDQNGFGLCWAFSSTKATMYIRAVQGQPPVRLSAYWVAGKVKGWQDEGGWGSASLEQIVKAGVPAESFCPKYSRSYDTPEAAANAELHKVTEWWDGSDDRERNRKIMVSAFLLGLPPVIDLNWLSHSMCGCRLVSLNPLTVDFDNSWGEGDNRGLYRATGEKAIPDNIVVPRVVKASLI